jgi:hypothetical protein
MADQAEMQSPESRMMALLDAEDTIQNDDPVNQDEERDDQPEAESEEEETEETSDDGEDEETEEESEDQPIQSLKLKVNGEEIEKPLEEVIALAQQGFDYTKKTQELAEQRKGLEEYAQAVQAQEQAFQQQVQLNQALIGDVAQLTAIDQQLAAYANVNWSQMSDTDFVEAQKLFFTYNQLQQQRATLAQQFEAKQNQLMQTHQQALAKRVQEGQSILAREIPNWSRETSQAIISTGKEYGFTDDELSGIVDPRHVKVLHDAMQWRKLKSNTSVKNKISTAKPIVKPGAKDTKQLANSQVKQTREALRKTGKSDLATKLIEQML